MFEHASKVELTQSGLYRQVCQQQRLVEMLLNILFHPSGDRRSQTAAHLRHRPLQLAIALHQVRHQQSGGTAERQLVGTFLPIAVK
ncbi:Uncharacterised protein [Serratia quinivorans]|nr:Uncharacterised protein [Serratia quinivorans]